MNDSSGDWERGLNASTEVAASRPSGLAEPRMPALTVLAHPDLRRVGERVLLPELVSGRTVELSRLEPRFAQPWGGELRPLADSHLSRSPVRLVPIDETGAVRLAIRRGLVAV